MNEFEKRFNDFFGDVELFIDGVKLKVEPETNWGIGTIHAINKGLTTEHKAIYGSLTGKQVRAKMAYRSLYGGKYKIALEIVLEELHNKPIHMAYLYMKGFLDRYHPVD